MLILKNKKVERKITSQYSILHQITEIKRIALLLMVFLMLSGCASFAHEPALSLPVSCKEIQRYIRIQAPLLSPTLCVKQRTIKAITALSL